MSAAEIPAREPLRLTLNQSEACIALGVKPTTLWRLEKRGLIKAVPGIRHKLYSVEMLKRFVEGKVSAS